MVRAAASRSVHCLAVAGLLFATVAVAQDDTEAEDPEAEAKALFESGRKAYDAGDFAKALQRWKLSYGYSGQPKLQYNIGLAHEALGQDKKALTAYRVYVKWESNGPRADDVRGRIARLDKTTGKQAPETPEADDRPAPVEQAQTVVPVDSEPQTSAQPQQSGSVDVLPIALLAGGGALIVAGTITGIMALGADSDLDDLCGTERQCDPEDLSRRDELADDIDTLSLTTDILLPVGFVVAGLGVYFLLDGEDAPEVACGPRGCHGTMQWRF